MSAYDRILATLSALKLYDLTAQSGILRELQSYQVALAAFETALQNYLQNTSIWQCDTDTLARYERLLGLTVRAGLPDAVRRSQVGFWLSNAAEQMTCAGMLAGMYAAGLDCQLLEYPDQARLQLVVRGFVGEFSSTDAVKESVLQLLPAHLQVEFVIETFSFDEFDAKNYSWDMWDAIDFTWDRFDLSGHQLEYKEETTDAQQQ